ncbi:MAG TPA: hypothetical protein ENH44_02180 [Actinobacteria bacterium]|nr:hypothetical protein [Actinomycetota bacterium]
MASHKTEPGQINYPADWELLDSSGVGWFTTRTVHRLPDGSIRIWNSRGHRKGLGLEVIAPPGAAGSTVAKRKSPWLTFWAPGRLTWWVAVCFMTGAFLFSLGSVISLVPRLFDIVSQSAMALDLIFFGGSIFFTTAAWLQLLESMNAGEEVSLNIGDMKRGKFRWFAWMPRRIDYLASLVQFLGTLMFNVSTFSAMVTWASRQGEERFIWRPDFVGSIFFMTASILVLLEVCHRFWCFRPHSISWWVMAVNLAGSIGFMLSAVFAFITPKTTEPLNMVAVNVFTFQGAVCFFIGAYLLLPEMFSVPWRT